MDCPLCKQKGKPFYGDEFFECGCCSGIYKDKKYYVDEAAEKRRYEEHNNDVNDIRYQNFVSPITSYVFGNFGPHHCGLDFGSGTQPVISKILQDEGYNIRQFDPFFANEAALLKGAYDYIVSCEVMEHFHDPAAEFGLLRGLLKPGGALVCMTHLYDEDVDFNGWYYKNDCTHVFIYRRETISYIADHYGFTNIKIDNRLIALES